MNTTSNQNPSFNLNLPMKLIPILIISLVVNGAAALRRSGIHIHDEAIQNDSRDSSSLRDTETLQLRPSAEHDVSSNSIMGMGDNDVQKQHKRTLGKSTKSKKSKSSKSKDAGNSHNQNQILSSESEVPINNNDVESEPSDNSDDVFTLEDVAWGAISASIVAAAQGVQKGEGGGTVSGSGGGLDAIVSGLAGAAQEAFSTLQEEDGDDDDDWESESWLITLPSEIEQQSTNTFSFGTDKFDATAPNVALGKSSMASSEAQPSSKAFDGDVNTTRWASDVSLNETQSYLQVDLGEDYAISSVNIVWDYASAISYDIQVSLDDISYTTVWSKTNGEADMGEVESYLGGIIIRYVRMSGLIAGKFIYVILIHTSLE